ncbi:MAG: 50S ribosomal protein L21, partial [Terriglobales bacterium]
SKTGAPFIAGAKVTGKILCNMKARKVIVYHQRPKKGTRKKQGHRQHYTRVLINTIELNDEVLAKAEERAEKPRTEKKEKPATKKEAKAPAKKAESKGKEKATQAKEPAAKAAPKTKKQ